MDLATCCGLKHMATSVLGIVRGTPDLALLIPPWSRRPTGSGPETWSRLLPPPGSCWPRRWYCHGPWQDIFHGRFAQCREPWSRSVSVPVTSTASPADCSPRPRPRKRPPFHVPTSTASILLPPDASTPSAPNSATACGARDRKVRTCSSSDLVGLMTSLAGAH